jgi:hypothetical protein
MKTITSDRHSFRKLTYKLIARLSLCSGLCSAAIIISASTALGAASPEDTVKEITTKLKSEGSPVAVLDYIHWEKAFDEFPAPAKAELGIKTPEDLRVHLKDALTDPSAFIKRSMESRRAKLPPEQQPMIDAMMAPLAEQVKKQFADAQSKLKRTEFEVGKAEINGANASVPLTAKVDGESRTDTVRLVKVNDAWLLESLKMAESAAMSGLGGAKANPVPNVGAAVNGPAGAPATTSRAAQGVPAGVAGE